MKHDKFNSQVPHFLQRVSAYCAKVLPCVFDNSLSYYEFLGKMCHKLNECIDAINAQNLNIIEFTKMVQLEMEKFEEYVDTRMTDFENEIKAAWEEFKTQLRAEWEEFKNRLETEWENEKRINEAFRNEMRTAFEDFKTEIQAEMSRFETQIKQDFETFKTAVNAEIEQFENNVNADMSAFKTTMQNQQNEFELHMTEIFNQFTENESAARTEFENNLKTSFEDWKTNTLNAIETQLSGWESETKQLLIDAINHLFSDYEKDFDNRLNTIENKVDAIASTGGIVGIAGDDTALKTVTVTNSYAYLFDDSGNFTGEGYCVGTPPEISTPDNGYMLLTTPINQLPQGSISLTIFRGAGSETGKIYVSKTLSKNLDISLLEYVTDFTIPQSADSPVSISLPSATTGYIVIYTHHSAMMFSNSMITRAKPCYMTDAANTMVLLPVANQKSNTKISQAVSCYSFKLSPSTAAVKSLGQFMLNSPLIDFSQAYFEYEVVSDGDFNNEIASANPRLYFYSKERATNSISFGVMLAMNSQFSSASATINLYIVAKPLDGWDGNITVSSYDV